MRFLVTFILVCFTFTGCFLKKHKNDSPVRNCKVSQISGGAEIICPDGSHAFVYNGSNGSNGSNGTNGSNGVNGTSCTVEQLSTGAKITCEDGSFAYIYNGHDGANGQDGTSCTIVSLSNGAKITCGAQDVTIYNGTNGTDGTNGTNGTNGTSCSVTQLANGVRVTCGTSNAVIYNGQDAAPSAYEVTEIIDPCGDGPGFDEVLLKLANGKIMAHYAGGGNLQFLTILSPGNYTTTDASACRFNVDNNNRVTW